MAFLMPSVACFVPRIERALFRYVRDKKCAKNNIFTNLDADMCENGMILAVLYKSRKTTNFDSAGACFNKSLLPAIDQLNCAMSGGRGQSFTHGYLILIVEYQKKLFYVFNDFHITSSVKFCVIEPVDTRFDILIGLETAKTLQAAIDVAKNMQTYAAFSNNCKHYCAIMIESLCNRVPTELYDAFAEYKNLNK